MLSSYFIAAAASLVFAATSLAEPVPMRLDAPVADVVVKERAAGATSSPTPLGCFKSPAGLVALANGYAQFQTSGACADLCTPLKHPVIAINYQMCSCADSVDVASMVDAKYCDTQCPGYGTVYCGGNGTAGAVYYSLWNDGMLNNDAIPGASSASTNTDESAASNTASSSPSVVTIGGQTVVVTQSSSPGSGSGSGGPNTVGIVAGVVVGLVIIAGVGLGAWLYIRNKRRREVEEEHKRQAAISAYTPSSAMKPGSSGDHSLADNRLDQSIMTARRMSDGSIADNRDYSRRILKVTNA